MKIISLGLDNSALDENSKLSQRIKEYKKLVERYDVIVPISKNKIIGLISVFLQVRKLFKKEKYDVITVQDQYFLALLSWFLARKFKIGLHIQIHGWEKFYGIRKLIAKFVLPRANAIRVVSQRLKRQLIDEFGIREEKITAVPIYVPVVSRQVSDIRQEIKKDKFIFLTIGRLVPVKNIKMQIEAINKLRARNELRIKDKELKIELWIVGEGLERESLEFMVKNFRLQDHVKFFGWQDDLREFYEQASVFLLTSNSEGWGMVIIEAASYGLPIIMTDVGCAGEVIKDGESGIVIPVGDKEKLTEAMIKLIENDNLRKELGQAALGAIKKLPTKEETFKLYKESWEKASKNN